MTNCAMLALQEKHNLIALETVVVDALDALKAHDIVSIPVTSLTPMTDIMIIGTATSARHVRALTNHVATILKAAGITTCVEGKEDGEWVLIDVGNVIVHIMLAKTRAFYDLEGLWQS